MKRLAVVSILFVMIQACQPVKTKQSETKSAVHNGEKWPNPRAIPVCVMNRGEIGDELYNDVKNFTNNEYASKAGVSFTGWGQCAGGDFNARMIRVYFNRVHNWDSAGGIAAGGGLSWVGPNPGGCGSCNGGTMRIDIGRSGNFANNGFRNFTIAQTRGTMIHEFGHALGLIHEHERTDAPRCRDIDARQRAGGAVVYVGNYDPNSIMNYCKNEGITSLSGGDVGGLHFLYPALRDNPRPTPNPGPIPTPGPQGKSICESDPRVNRGQPYRFDESCKTTGGAGCIADLPCRYVDASNPGPNPTPTPPPAPIPPPVTNGPSVCETDPRVNRGMPYYFDESCKTVGGAGCIADLPCRYRQ